MRKVHIFCDRPSYLQRLTANHLSFFFSSTFQDIHLTLTLLRRIFLDQLASYTNERQLTMWCRATWLVDLTCHWVGYLAWWPNTSVSNFTLPCIVETVNTKIDKKQNKRVHPVTKPVVVANIRASWNFNSCHWLHHTMNAEKSNFNS